MTVLSRGARVRRGGRRPGWALLTTLLVLAIGASTALVFTNRVELLKLAVILALWAAVAGAFVSVLYRRQSDADQSRVRDLKLVYDLQLDREISARREYELTVESQLRRELASELRAQAEDDLSALRAELAALRTNLEILFDANLDSRPALETDPNAARALTDWVSSDRIRPVRPDSSDQRDVAADNRGERIEDTSIIDVPEEPLLPPRQPTQSRERVRFHYETPPAEPAPRFEPAPAARFEPEHRPPPTPEPAAWVPPQSAAPQPTPSQPTPSQPTPSQPSPPRQPAPSQSAPAAAAPQPAPSGWQPVGPEGQWVPAGLPGSNWGSAEPVAPPPPATPQPPTPQPPTPPQSATPPQAAAPPPEGGRRARRSGSEAPPSEPQYDAPQYGGTGRRARSRHAAEDRDWLPPGAADPAANGVGRHGPPAAPSPPGPAPAASATPPPAAAPATPAPPPPRLAPPPPPEPAPRHRGSDAEPASPTSAHGLDPETGGQSVADLLARLQVEPSGGGRRRRRDG